MFMAVFLWVWDGLVSPQFALPKLDVISGTLAVLLGLSAIAMFNWAVTVIMLRVMRRHDADDGAPQECGAADSQS
jgi:hypothetical protein